jgi:hypothetical protein
MKAFLRPLWLLMAAIGPSVMAQEPQMVTLRFLSFPKCADPQPVELMIGEGEVLEVKTPTNALSPAYQVKRLATWSVGKLTPAESADQKPSFASYGAAPSLASSDQLILLIRNGKENKDGMQVIPLDNSVSHFGGGKFFFMNASTVDIAGMLGGTEFLLKPNAHAIIEPGTIIKRANADSEQSLIEFSFRKEGEARASYSSNWPSNPKARSMVFFYHDPQNECLRMHTIRDYVAQAPESDEPQIPGPDGSGP